MSVREPCHLPTPDPLFPSILCFDCDPVRLGVNGMKQGKARFRPLWTVRQLCPQMFSGLSPWFSA